MPVASASSQWKLPEWVAMTCPVALASDAAAYVPATVTASSRVLNSSTPIHASDFDSSDDIFVAMGDSLQLLVGFVVPSCWV